MVGRGGIYGGLHGDGQPVGGRREAEPTPDYVVNSVIPCAKGSGCSWPACPLACDGRPGKTVSTIG